MSESDEKSPWSVMPKVWRLGDPEFVLVFRSPVVGYFSCVRSVCRVGYLPPSHFRPLVCFRHGSQIYAVWETYVKLKNEHTGAVSVFC